MQKKEPKTEGSFSTQSPGLPCFALPHSPHVFQTMPRAGFVPPQHFPVPFAAWTEHSVMSCLPVPSPRNGNYGGRNTDISVHVPNRIPSTRAPSGNHQPATRAARHPRNLQVKPFCGKPTTITLQNTSQARFKHLSLPARWNSCAFPLPPGETVKTRSAGCEYRTQHRIYDLPQQQGECFDSLLNLRIPH